MNASKVIINNPTLLELIKREEIKERIESRKNQIHNESELKLEVKKHEPNNQNTKDKEKPKKSKVKAVYKGTNYSQQTKIRLNCQICQKTYEVTPSRVKQRKTCLDPDCTRELKSRSQLAKHAWKETKYCQHPECDNKLKRGKDRKYCSQQHAAEHRELIKRSCIKPNNNEFNLGDYVEASKAGKNYIGYVGGFSDYIKDNNHKWKEKRISIYDKPNGGKRIVQVSASKVKLIELSNVEL